MPKFLSHILGQYQKNSKKIIFLICTAVLLIGGFAVYKILNPTLLGSVSIVPTFPSAENPFYFIYELKAGETISDSATVINRNGYKTSVSISSIDVVDGSTQEHFSLKSIGEEQSNIGKWLTFEEENINMEAESTENIGFTLTIPADTKNGVYWGGAATTEGYGLDESIGVATEVRIVSRVKVVVTDNPQIIEKMEIDKFKLYWKYILSSIIISSVALIFILVSQFSSTKK